MNRKKKLKEWPHIWTAVFLILGRITLYHRNCAYSVNIKWKINHLMSGYILFFLEFQKSLKDKSIWHGWSWCWVLFTWISRHLIRLSNMEMVQGSCVHHLSSINKGGPPIILPGWCGNLAAGSWNNNAPMTTVPNIPCVWSSQGWDEDGLFVLISVVL